MPKGYTLIQIILHWAVAVLISLQFLLSEGMEGAWDQVSRGQAYTPTLLGAAHVFGGILILLLVLWRLTIKLRRGAPALPENEPALLKLAAHAAHLALYLLMIVVPVSGLVAWFGGVKLAGEGHETLQGLLLIVIFLHLGGALYQQFVLKSDVLDRMRTPEA